MQAIRHTLRTAAVLLLALAPIGALAHHGWNWTSDQDFELTGALTEIYLGNPHAVLKVRAAEAVWTVELAPPSQTARSGFVEGVAKVGDTVTAQGHRSRDPKETRMKAESIKIGAKTYIVYPGR